MSDPKSVKHSQMKLVRSKERLKSVGECFTPRALVLEMLKRLPEESWADPKNDVLDPTCGSGNFLTCAAYLKIKVGLTPVQALRSTFGVDIMLDNVLECRERVLQHVEKAANQQRNSDWLDAVESNIVCADVLAYDFSFPQVYTSRTMDDHILSNRYATRLSRDVTEDRREQRWCNAYFGARGELAVAKRLGKDAYKQCREHLEKACTSSCVVDVDYDLLINGIKIDFKATCKADPRNGILLDPDKPKADVLYVLSEYEKECMPVQGERFDMKFKFAGCCWGELSNFETIYTHYGNKLRSRDELLQDWWFLEEALKL